MVLYRSTKVCNRSNHWMKMTEERFCAPSESCKSTTLQPGASMTIQATVFSDAVKDSSRTSTIVVSVDVDGVKPLYLTPEYFVEYSDITFTFDENNRKLDVQSVKPDGIIGEIARIRNFFHLM